jgi:hypothetical protein
VAKREEPAVAELRYEAFVREVTRSGKLWALQNDLGWANWSDEEGPIFPVWSSREEARCAAEATSRGYEPEELQLSEFILELLPGLRDRGFMLGINLNDNMGGIDLACDEFQRVLGKSDA